MSDAKKDVANNIFVSLAMVHQLTDSYLMRQLAQFDLGISQFNLLSHLSRNPEQAVTVSQLASALQMNQPATTKIVNKLHAMALLDINKDTNDGRKKWVSINSQGLAKTQQAYDSFQPFMSELFADWDQQEMQDTLGKLNKLKDWMDKNRGV